MERQEALHWLVNEQKLAITRAGRALSTPRAAWYRPMRDRRAGDEAVIERLNTVVGRHGRWGVWKCFHWLRQRGAK